MEIGKGIHRIGSGLVNVYLVEEGGYITIVDAGVPGYWGDLPTALGKMGSSLDKVHSVVLTHGHPDHVGFAERIRREIHTPVRVHEDDAALARGEVPNPSRGFGPFRILPMLSFLIWGMRRGGLGMKPIKEVVTFGDGATLDVPGSPRVILVPGHTPGSAALHMASRSTLFVGDAMATRSVMTGATGPQIAPFTADPKQARESLSRLEGIDATTVLPGHGEPWTGGVDEAIRRVRASVPKAN